MDSKPPKQYIEYVVGDATIPSHRDHIESDSESYAHCIVHVNNDIGAWGKGFVVPLGKRYPQAKLDYDSWRKECGTYSRMPLGECRISGPFFINNDIDKRIYVSNMIGQYGIKLRENGKPPVEYSAIHKALDSTVKKLYELTGKKCIIHMPRIGCGLAGGKWTEIEKILDFVYMDNANTLDILHKFVVYDLP
jgi:O-acetyl-ADP-ribose deacetylase (regulator of RNase III)